MFLMLETSILGNKTELSSKFIPREGEKKDRYS